jgi:hypothetical protein
MPAGTLLSGAAELAISTTAGLLSRRWIGERLAQTIIDAGFASVIRATAKQLKAPIVADALADDSRRANFVIRPGGRVVAANRGNLGGYVGGGRLNGYVTGGGGADALGGYVAGSAANNATAAAIVANAQN